jgi:hypothetical protein
MHKCSARAFASTKRSGWLARLFKPEESGCDVKRFTNTLLGSRRRFPASSRGEQEHRLKIWICASWRLAVAVRPLSVWRTQEVILSSRECCVHLHRTPQQRVRVTARSPLSSFLATICPPRMTHFVTEFLREAPHRRRENYEGSKSLKLNGKPESPVPCGVRDIFVNGCIEMMRTPRSASLRHAAPAACFGGTRYSEGYWVTPWQALLSSS